MVTPNGFPLEQGTGPITVALYGASYIDPPPWEEFDPRPIEGAAADLSVHQRLGAMFSYGDWRQRFDLLGCVPQSYAPDVYCIPSYGRAKEYSVATGEVDGLKVSVSPSDMDDERRMARVRLRAKPILCKNVAPS